MRTLVVIAVLGLTLVTACQSSDVSRALGASCDTSRECDDRCLPPSGDWPGGFCTIACETDRDCPGDAACVDEEGSRVCLFTCETDPGCAFLGNGYTCQDRDGVKVCRG